MRKSISRSRLSRRLENQSKRNLFLSILGIIIVFFLVIKFGIPLLVNFSLFVSGSKTSNSRAKRSTTDFITAPVINTQLSATNSAEITISGTSSPKYTIDLYVNGRNVDKTQTDNEGKYSFQTTLDPGENEIKTKAKKDDNESDYSNIVSIIFNNKPPMLEVSSPSDGQLFTKDQENIIISGTTDENVRVTVNGFWAIIDENNKFTYNLHLNEGENQIKIEAVDQAGNKTEKQLKVTRSQ